MSMLRCTLTLTLYDCFDSTMVTTTDITRLDDDDDDIVDDPTDPSINDLYKSQLLFFDKTLFICAHAHAHAHAHAQIVQSITSDPSDTSLCQNNHMSRAHNFDGIDLEHEYASKLHL